MAASTRMRVSMESSRSSGIASQSAGAEIDAPSAEKAIGRDGGFVVTFVAGADRGEGNAALFAPGPRPGDVQEDAEEPGFERRAAFEAVDASHSAEPGFLHDLRRHFAVADEGTSDAQHGVVVAVHQGREGGFIAGADACREGRVVAFE